MIELNYKKMGSGQPMIILHGLFGSLDNWMTLGKKFSERHEVFLVDQRNHGQSEHTDEFSYDLLADDMRDLIQKENMVDPILVGHSMGGKTIMNFALRHRGMADKLFVSGVHRGVDVSELLRVSRQAPAQAYRHFRS